MKVYLLVIINILLISSIIYLVKKLNKNINKTKGLLAELDHKIDEQNSFLTFETQVCPAKEDKIELGKEHIDTLRNEIQTKKEILKKLKQK